MYGSKAQKSNVKVKIQKPRQVRKSKVEKVYGSKAQSFKKDKSVARSLTRVRLELLIGATYIQMNLWQYYANSLYKYREKVITHDSNEPQLSFHKKKKKKKKN